MFVAPVPFVVMLQGEAQATDVALKLDHPVVRFQVGLQVAVLPEGFITDVARKLKRTGRENELVSNRCMGFQGTPLLKSTVAVRALIDRSACFLGAVCSFASVLACFICPTFPGGMLLW